MGEARKGGTCGRKGTILTHEGRGAARPTRGCFGAGSLPVGTTMGGMSDPSRDPRDAPAPPGQSVVEDVLTRCLERVAAVPELHAELEASARDFFVHGSPSGTTRETLLAARRHLEWFLHERPSAAAGGRPLEGLLEELGVGEAERALVDSFSGVFEVEEVLAGEGAWVRDLAGLASYALAEPGAADMFEVGDLLVGRLFPLERGLHHLSRAAGFFRDDELRAAVVRDLERLRGEGGSHVLRILQGDLERMFFQPSAAATDPAAAAEAGPDKVAEARAFLRTAGLSSSDARRLLARLTAAPFDPGRLVHGARDALGDALDQLAFHTHADLDEARKLLTQAWAQRSAEGAGPAAPDASSALEAFDRGRLAGRDVEELFDDLERDLALAGDEGPGELDEGALSPAPDFPGVVGAMVDEFLWERGRKGADVASLECLRTLARFASAIGVFEELTAAELLRFTTFWLLEHRELDSPKEARRLVVALGAFCEWAEEGHEHPLASEFGETLTLLEESLPRAVSLNLALGRAARDAGDTGELLHYLGTDGGAARVRDGDEHEHAVIVPAALRALLRPGDPLRGRVQIDGSLSVFCCYPPQAVGLRQA